MVLIILIAIWVLFLIWIFRDKDSAKNLPILTKKDCPPHRWRYNINDAGDSWLQCEICQKLPGYTDDREVL
jgi:hypothetical protein